MKKKALRIPEFVKQAGIDINQVKGNITTRANAYASVVNFIKEKEALSSAEQIVYESHYKEACEDWNLNFNEIQKELQDLEPRLEGTDFAIKEAKLYPLVTNEHISKAASNLYRDRNKLPYDWRKKGGEKILKLAFQHSIDIPHLDYFLSLAGVSGCDKRKLASDVAYRGLLANEKLSGVEAHNIMDEYIAVAETLVKGAEEGLDEDTDALVEIIAAIDEAGGMNPMYGEIPTPEELVHNMNLLAEMAEAENIATLPDESEIEVCDISEEDIQKSASIIGGSFKEAYDNCVILDDEEKKHILSKLDEKDCKLFRKIIGG